MSQALSTTTREVGRFEVTVYYDPTQPEGQQVVRTEVERQGPFWLPATPPEVAQDVGRYDEFDDAVASAVEGAKGGGL